MYGCCCTYKGNQIFANHNGFSDIQNLSYVVVVPTKVIKFLLITTVAETRKYADSCCCTYKGNQIFANHNSHQMNQMNPIVVVVTTKVIKFLLITTYQSLIIVRS